MSTSFDTVDVKPGEKTTEFWLSITASMIGTVLILFGAALAGGVIPGNENAAEVGNHLILVGAGLVGVISAGYSVSRGIAKKGAKSPTPSTPLDTDSIFS